MLIVAVLASQGTTVDGALNTFAQHIHGALRAVGKTAVVWEGELVWPRPSCETEAYEWTEMLLAHSVDLDKSTLVM